MDDFVVGLPLAYSFPVSYPGRINWGKLLIYSRCEGISLKESKLNSDISTLSEKKTLNSNN